MSVRQLSARRRNFSDFQIQISWTPPAGHFQHAIFSAKKSVEIVNMSEEMDFPSNGVREDENDEDDDVVWHANDVEDISDEPVGEGEEPSPPRLEPSYDKANAIKFFTFCSGLEAVWQATHRNKSKKQKGPTDEDKLCKILPPKVLAYLDIPLEGSDRPESIFPIFRLLMPDRDSSRQFKIAEKKIALMYASVLGLSKSSHRYKMLFDYGDPKLAGGSAGDFPSVVFNVVEKTKITGRGSDFTVGDMNAALDDFVSLYAKTRGASAHEFHSSKAKSRKPKLQDLRMNWLQELNRDIPGRRGLSALEHKWLVCILTNQMRIGLVRVLMSLLLLCHIVFLRVYRHHSIPALPNQQGWGKLLEWYDPYAKMLWSSHNSLKAICDKLCDPDFALERLSLKRQQQKSTDCQHGGLDSYLPKSEAPPEFGCPFSPMLSVRTGFDRILDDISGRHRAFLASPECKERHPHIPSDSLSFRHPAFSIETKLDGERQLIHISKDGIVKMHSRSSNWYR